MNDLGIGGSLGLIGFGFILCSSRSTWLVLGWWILCYWFGSLGYLDEFHSHYMINKRMLVVLGVVIDVGCCSISTVVVCYQYYQNQKQDDWHFQLFIIEKNIQTNQILCMDIFIYICHKSFVDIHLSPNLKVMHVISILRILHTSLVLVLAQCFKYQFNMGTCAMLQIA